MSSAADAPVGPGLADAGWYPDPLGHFPHRYWDGAAWTQRAAWNGAVYDDPAPSGPAPAEIDHLEYLQAYLDGAIRRGVVRQRDVQQLLYEVRSWEQLPHLDPPAPATRADTAPQAPAVPPEPAPAPALTWAELDRPATPAPVPSSIDLRDGRRPVAATSAPVGPGPVRRRLSAMAHTVSADLAVHWFADLGALLLFVGLFGFVAFAFADVQVGWRPVAEVAIPLTLFGVSAFLRRRGTPAVADVLVLLGGAMVPIVLIAAFSDGATPPPDLHGAALAATLAGALGAVSLVLALVTWRRPASPLRFLVAPMAWLGVAAAGLGWGRAVPTGSDLATPTAAQWSAVLVAIALSAAFAHRWREHPLARAVLVSCWPGLVVAVLVTATTAGVEGWPVGPVVVGATATVATLEVLARRWVLPTTLAQATVAAGAAAAVADTWGSSRTAAVVMALAIIGAEARAHEGAPPLVPLGLLAASAGAWAVTLGQLSAMPWVALATSSGVWVWAAVRHHRPALFPSAVWRFGLWAALVPVAAASATASSVAVAQVGLAALVALVAVTARIRPRWADEVWATWVPTVAGAIWIWLLVTLPPAAMPAHVAAALLVLAFALAPKWPVLRLWTATAAAALTVGGLLWRVDASLTTAAFVLAATGAILVVASEVHRRRLAGHVGLIGLLTTAVAPALTVAAAAPASDRVSLADAAVSTVVVAALVVVVVIEEVRGSSIADLFERMLRRTAEPMQPTAPDRTVAVTRRLPLVAALPAIAVVVAEWVDLAGWWPPTSAWLAVAAITAMTAVLVVARVLAPHRRPAATIAALEALALSCLLAALTAPAAGPRVVALGLIVAQAVLAGPPLRRSLTIWVGWAAGGLLVPAVVALTDLPQDLAGFPLQVAGAAAAITALLLRDRRPRDPASDGTALGVTLAAPIVTGSIVASVGLAAGLTDGGTVAGVACALAAATALVLVLLLDAPWASLLPWVLGVAALGLFLPVDPQQQPWVFIPVAAVAVVAATVLRPGDPAIDWWRRWDVPPLVLAAGVAFVAMGLGLDAGTSATVTTWCGMGGLAIAVGAQRRWAPAVVVGAAAVVVGTGVAGPSWLAGSLLGVSVASAVTVTRTSGPARTTLRWVAALAATGSWISLLVRADGGAVSASVATALLGALVVLGVALALQLELLDRAGALNVAVPGLGGVGVAALWWLDAAQLPDRSGWLVALAVAGATGGAGAAAGPMGWPWLRELGATTALAAGGFVIAATGPTVDQVVVVATAAALVAAIGALALRLTERATAWQRPLLLDVGGLMVVALASSIWASAAAGTFVLAATAALAIAVAAGSPAGPARVAGQVVTAITVPLTWGRTVEWLDLPAARWVPITALLGGAAMAALGALTRWRRPDPGWALTVMVPSGCAVVWAISARYAGEVDGALPGLGVALAVLLVAAAAALAAGPLSQQWLRVAAVAAGWFAAAMAAEAVGAGRDQLVAAAAAIALGATLAVVALSVAQRAASWVPPLEVTAAAATVIAWLLVDRGRPTLVATGLLLTGAELAAFGVARRQSALLLASPWALCAAWLVTARASFDDGAVWFTVPVGLTVLVTVALARRQRGDEGHEAGSRLLSALEFLGIALMVVTPITEAVVTSLANVALSLAIGLGVAAWGVVTRVRHRLAAGAVVVVISLLVLVVVPMVDVTRRITGSGVWLALAALGLLAILVAALLERSRRLAHRAVQRLHELTEGWE